MNKHPTDLAWAFNFIIKERNNQIVAWCALTTFRKDL